MKIIKFERYREYVIDGRSCFYDRLRKVHGTVIEGNIYEFATEKELRICIKKCS